jgi:hypothetical protein
MYITIIMYPGLIRTVFAINPCKFSITVIYLLLTKNTLLRLTIVVFKIQYVNIILFEKTHES